MNVHEAQYDQDLARFERESRGLQRHIETELTRIEQEFGVTVLYACESGSRAWGFASTNSDYDVRFIYAHPPEWYLTVEAKRDVIDAQDLPAMDPLDLSGWDITKALKLYRKSNPPLLEWLRSPIVYRNQGILHARLTTLLPDYYSPIACMYHYLHMARGNYRQYLQRERVWIKKYLYVVRPVLCCLWIDAGYGVPPVVLDAMVESPLCPAEPRAALLELLTAKRAGQELDYGEPVPVINAWLADAFAHLDRRQYGLQNPERPTVSLDKVLLETLVDTYGAGSGVLLLARDA